jgi:membrane protease YdiL (CAAX protease family)
MESYNNKKPLITQGWLRALIFIIFYLAILILAGVFVVLIWKAGNTGAENNVPGTLLPYLMIIINTVVSALIVWLFRKIMDRQSFMSMGFEFKKYGSHAGVGFFLGVLLLCVGTLILWFTKNLQWTDINFNGSELFTGLITMLLVAFYEELVFRGYILNNLLSSLNKWAALLISSGIFALVHIANPNFSIISAVNIFLAGLLLGINYIYTKNLWFAIMLHFSWNFFQGPILGYEVSGLNLSSLFEHEVHGSELLTGGKFGFEASLLATVLYILAIAVLVWVYRKKYELAAGKLTS